jgi:hypothetical protein
MQKTRSISQILANSSDPVTRLTFNTNYRDIGLSNPTPVPPGPERVGAGGSCYCRVELRKTCGCRFKY